MPLLEADRWRLFATIFLRVDIFSWDWVQFGYFFGMDNTARIVPSAEFIAHVSRAQRTLYAFILSLVRHLADADDVLQETNIIMWQKAAEFQSGSDFMAWAFRIAQLQVMAHAKRQQRSRVQFDAELIKKIATVAEEELRNSDRRRIALAGCLQKLPEDQRALLVARYEPNGSVNELAKARQTTPKALSEMLRRLRQALLQCMERTLAREARA